MDKLTFTIELIKILVWPLTILIIFSLLQKYIRKIPSSLFQEILSRKSIRAKIGNTEIELGEMQKLRESINLVAQEPDPKKRLELAKKALSIETAISELSEEDIDLLKEYKKKAHCFVTSVYDNSMKEEELNKYTKLVKLGLISGWPAYGGESIDYITPIGEEVLQKVDNQNT